MLADYIKELEPILMVILGWLFGLFTSPIAERIRRYYRRKDLIRAVTDEMLFLQNVMAVSTFQISARYAEASDKFLDKLIPILDIYKGVDRDENLIAGIKESRSRPEAERAAIHRAMRKPNVGLALKQYSVPLFTSQVSDLAICRLDFQRRVLHIRYRLDLYNQIAAFAQSQAEKTFDNPNPGDKDALIQNQESAYRSARVQAEVIVEAIADLRQKYADR